MKKSVIVFLYLLGIVIPDVLVPFKWGIYEYTIIVVALGTFFIASYHRLYLHCCIVLASSFIAVFLARIGFRLWMEEGFFQWSWLNYLAENSEASGEGAYRLVQYEMFLVSYLALSLLLIAVSLTIFSSRRREPAQALRGSVRGRRGSKSRWASKGEN